MPRPVIYQLNRAELARFHRQIKVTDSGCWEWQGAKMSNGYGKWSRGPGAPIRAIHRISWEHFNNQPIPDKMQLDHLCRNRGCCNPEHLEPVTASQNTLRQEHYERAKTECPKGHPYDETNTRHTRDGKRVCKQCDRARKRKRPINHAAIPPTGAGAAEET